MVGIFVLAAFFTEIRVLVETNVNGPLALLLVSALAEESSTYLDKKVANLADLETRVFGKKSISDDVSTLS